METIFKNDWLEISKENDNYKILYNSGDHADSINEVEVTEEDAILAQQGDIDAEKIIIKYQNIKMGLI